MSKLNLIQTTLALFLAASLWSCTSSRLAFTETKEGKKPDRNDSLIINYINVTVDTGALLSPDKPTSKIPLPGRSGTISIVRKRVDRDKLGHIGWYGVIQDDPGS